MTVSELLENIIEMAKKEEIKMTDNVEIKLVNMEGDSISGIANQLEQSVYFGSTSLVISSNKKTNKHI